MTGDCGGKVEGLAAVAAASIIGDTKFFTAVIPPAAFALVILSKSNVTLTGTPATEPIMVTLGLGEELGTYVALVTM